MLPTLVVLALAVYTLLPQLATLESTAQVMRSMRWWAVALALIAQAASYLGNGYTVLSTARLTNDRVGLWPATRLALAAGSVGVLTGGPVGYGAATFYWTRRRGMSRQGSMLCGWLPGLMNTVVLVGLTAMGLIHLTLRHLLDRSQLVSIGFLALSAALIAGGAVWVLAREDRMAKFATRLLPAWSGLRRRTPDQRAIDGTVRRLVSTRRLVWHGGWRHPLLGAIANAGFDVLTLLCLFVATRYRVSPAVLLAGYGLPQLVGRLTFLPGGLGIVEGGMVGLYVTLGVRAPTAVLVVLAYRGLSFWLPTIVGFALAAVLQHASRVSHRATESSGGSPAASAVRRAARPGAFRR